jgi:hypothetical protein
MRKGATMPRHAWNAALWIACLLLVSCGHSGQEQDGSTPAPSEVPAPTATLDFSDAKATLTIVRDFEAPLGHMILTAAVPLLFAIDDQDPEQDVIVWGQATGTGVLDGMASGTGGSYDIWAEWPVEYEVRGVLIPRRDVCRLILNVDEVLRLSEEVMVHAGPFGDVPMSGGVDEFTSFMDLQFTEIDNSVTVPSGMLQSVFTLDDWCLPMSTYCIYGCSVE